MNPPTRTPPAWLADPATSITDGGEVSASLGSPARRLFLAAVAEAEPDVLKSLRDAVLDLCRKALADDRANFLASRERGSLELYESPLWADCHAALYAWARRWHLTDDWIREAAQQTAHSWDWEIHTGSERRPGWLFGQFVFTWRESKRVPLDVSGWEPGREPRRAAERRIRAAIEQQVQEYLNGIEAIARKRGFRPLPPSRERGPKGQRIPRRYRWLAEWQVQGRTLEQIGRSEKPPVDARSVQEAIKKVAEDIGLTRRSRQ